MTRDGDTAPPPHAPQPPAPQGRPGRYAALLAAMLAAVLAVSAVIFVGVSADGLRGRDTPARDGGGAGNPVAPASAGTWVTAWATAPGGGEPGTETAGLAGRSVRNVVHTTAGGTRARVTLSNLYGRAPLTLTHASIAVSADPDTAAALAGTMRPSPSPGTRRSSSRRADRSSATPSACRSRATRTC